MKIITDTDFFKGATTFLFDLDATLGPYRQSDLSKAYFEGIENYAASRCDGARFNDAAMKAFEAMKKNDGTQSNRLTFAQTFDSLYPDFPGNIIEFYEEYYNSPEFNSIGEKVTYYRGSEKGFLKNLRAKGYKAVCATNPVFPMSANRVRMGWAGLDVEDFDFVTVFDDYSYCKPSPGYFLQAAAAAGSTPAECIMVGNDTLDDLEADRTGMRVLLITDYMKDRGNRDLAGVSVCAYEELLRLCSALPDIGR